MRKKKTKYLFAFLIAAVLAGCGENLPSVDLTVTPVPTVVLPSDHGDSQAQPTAEPTQGMPTGVPPELVIATPAPGQRFGYVQRVAEEYISDIRSTMTTETYPRVDGSTATLPLSEAVFMAATGEDATVAAEYVVHTKTTNSYKRLYDGEVDLLIVYEPAEEIVARMQTEPLCIKPIGMDALVFLANTSNPVESLTTEELVEIYSGRLDNWSKVGGPDKELLAFQRPLGSGSQSLMQKLVMGDVPMTTGDNVYRYSTMSDILEGMLSYNGEDNTLGYSVFYYANNMYFEKDLKLLGVNGVAPSTQTIYDGSYPLRNEFYAVIRTDEPADSNARKIFDWLTGEDGQRLVLETGYVPCYMPEGADISDVKEEQKEKTEVLATKPLGDGEYFIFVNTQNFTSEFYYGDMTVYNEAWEEIANFYNVTLNHAISGIYQNRYLPVGQIRMNPEGRQVARYGIYDLETGEYVIAPTYKAMEVLDAERGYYAVPITEDDWMDYQIIDGTGKVVLPYVRMEDWLTISKFGNGYLERFYDYSSSNGEFGGTLYRYYDENLVLKKVYSETASLLPDDADRLPGVEYYLLDNECCLVDANGEIVLNGGIFAQKYGDGETTQYQMAEYGLVLWNENNCYPVLYRGKVYVLDGNLELVRVTEPLADINFSGRTYYEDFIWYYDYKRDDYIYRNYDGETVTMQDGSPIHGIEISWSNTSYYLLYRREGTKLYVEKHTGEDSILCMEYPLQYENSRIQINFDGEDFITVLENSGETVQSPYTPYPENIPCYTMTLYQNGTKISQQKGLYEYVDTQSAEYGLWVITGGKRIQLENESIFEEYEWEQSLMTYVLIRDGEEVFSEEDCYLLRIGRKSISFMKGNYTYAVGMDGEVYIRALNNNMAQD